MHPLEVIGFYVTAFGMLLAFVVLPFSVIWLLIRPPTKEQMSDKSFTDFWGILFEEVKTDTRSQLSFYLVFVVRRAIFLLVGLFATQSAGV